MSHYDLRMVKLLLHRLCLASTKQISQITQIVHVPPIHISCTASSQHTPQISQCTAYTALTEYAAPPSLYKHACYIHALNWCLLSSSRALDGLVISHGDGATEYEPKCAAPRPHVETSSVHIWTVTLWNHVGVQFGW